MLNKRNLFKFEESGVSGGAAGGYQVDYVAMDKDLTTLNNHITAITEALKVKPDVTGISVDGQTLQPQVDKVLGDLNTIVPELATLSKEVTEVQAEYAKRAGQAKAIFSDGGGSGSGNAAGSGGHSFSAHTHL